MSVQVRPDLHTGTYDIARIRADFPILAERVRGGKPLIYLDNGATTQKPRAVIDALVHYYEHDNANVHRGVHALAERATNAYEAARSTVARFLNASSEKELVFTRGTTEAINLVAQSYARPKLKPGDEVLISHMEHHSNIVPWQLVCEQTGARLRVAPINDAGELIREEFIALLSGRTKVVSLVHLSNALGTINPVADLIREAHAAGAVVCLDGAQAAAHLPIDVQGLDADFYACSGHKAYGPTGIGALYGKRALLEAMPPWQGGGEMIASVAFDHTTYALPPHRFEAGTPPIAGAIGFAAALDYIDSLGREAIGAWEHQLLEYGTRVLTEIPEVRLIGTARDKGSILSFVLADIHPHDIGTVVDQDGIAIRAGHHCAQPVMERFGVPATVRASLALYNTPEELEALAASLRKVVALLR